MIELHILYQVYINDAIEITFQDADGYYCGYFSINLNCLFFNNFGGLTNVDFSKRKMIEYIKSIGFENIKIR